MTSDERLAQLKNEFEKGQAELMKLEQRRQEVCSTMLRISGAIQVLEELEDGHRRELKLAGVHP
jgi:hypothetical protein